MSDDTPPPRNSFPVLRSIDAATPFEWLKLGWADLRSCPLPSLFYGLCFSSMGYLLAFVLRDAPHLIAALTAGFLLLAPALSIGLYDISRRREQGLPCQLLPTLTVWRHNLPNIALFSLVLLVIFMVWARASLVVFAMFFTGDMPNLRSLMQQIIHPENYIFVGAWLGVGALFALIAFALSAISIPLMMDRRDDAITAILASIQSVLRNPGAMTVWAAIIAWAGAAGLMMGFFGIIVVGPLLGHATWHAYRALVVPR